MATIDQELEELLIQKLESEGKIAEYETIRNRGQVITIR